MTSPISKRYFLPLVLLTISLPAIAAESLPTAQDINDAAKKAKQTYNLFFEQTFEIRMQYEYSGRFLKAEDKETFYKTAEMALAELEQIATDQNNLKLQIENYHGDDWEALFGQTGLWRKLSADLLNTQTDKLEIDYHLARIEGKTASQAEQQYLMKLFRSDLTSCEMLKVSMEKIKCLGLSEPNELNDIAGLLAKSDCSDNPEMLLSLAILKNKYAPDKPLKTLYSPAKASELFGKIILADLSSGSDINSLNPFTAELAAFSAWQTNPFAYNELLLSIADTDKLKSCWALYAAAVSVAKTDPAKTIKLLMESDTLLYQQKSRPPDRSAETSSRLTAEYAYNYFTQNNIDCNLALAAFENYDHITSNIMTEDMRYLHGELLFDCGKTQNASAIFTKLTDGPKSIWHDKASLQLLKIKINTGKEETLPELQNFILNCSGQDEQILPLRIESLDLYCRTALARDNNNFAIQVLNLLDTAEQTPGLRYDLFKAQALYQLGRLEESAQYMSKAVIADGNSSAALAAQIASDAIDKIELWQKDANDFNELLQNCAALVDFANKSNNTPQTALLLAEVSLLNGKTSVNAFPITDEAISLRVQARSLMAQEKFDQSAKLWARIAELRRNETPAQTQKSWNWWQAKFYELDCLAKSPQAGRQNISHVIDVLCGSNPQIPAPWAEKLEELKEQLKDNRQRQ